VIFGSDPVSLRYYFPIVTRDMAGAEHHAQPLPPSAIYGVPAPPDVQPFLAEFDAEGTTVSIVLVLDEFT
jgi:hypothetical protein